ncbi:MAG TPA: ferric reductase-like transmembrane domain-containing protein [Bacillota bacterium]|nr:ferric reductase-like transmembrane domain-containing protein [Bacillota bacterium]
MEELLSQFAGLFPVWYTTRAAGLTSYALLFLSMVVGILQSMKWASPRSRSILYTIHNTTGWFGLLFGMIHGLVLVFDQHVGYSLGEILIPFTAHSETFRNGLGTIALYGLFLLVLSSDLMKMVGKKVWKSIHFLAFPSYLVALFHGVTLGTDSQYGWTQIMYLVTGGMVFLLAVFRFTLVRTEKSARLEKKQIRTS